MTKDDWHSRHNTVYKFGEHWEKQGKFKWFYENIAIFEADVEYTARGRTFSAKTTCHLTHEGKIELLESGRLNHDDFYLGFDIDWQSASFTQDCELRIDGSGPKIPGKYTVLIKPS